MTQEVHLTGPIILVHGAQRYTVRPLAKGGLAFDIEQSRRGTQKAVAPSTKLGRPFSPSTVRLQERMKADLTANRLHTIGEYTAHLMAEGGVTKGSAYQTVRREYERIVGKPPKPRTRRRGRSTKAKVQPARKPTLAARDALRQRLAKEASPQDAKHYVRWLVDHANIGIKQARPIVYRELRNLRG